MDLPLFVLTGGTVAPPAAGAAAGGHGLDENVIQLIFVILIVIGVLLAVAARGATPSATPTQRSWTGGIVFFVGLALGAGLLGVTQFLTGGSGGQAAAAAAPSGAGRTLFLAKPCPTCHTVPGVSTGTVGPALTKIGAQPRIAGVLETNRDNMVKWLLNPPGVKPGTAMPNNGLTEAEAGQLADFLLALK